MTTSNDRNGDRYGRIDSLHAIVQTANRLIDWFVSDPEVPSLFAKIPRAQLPIKLVGYALGVISNQDLLYGLSTFQNAEDVQPSNNNEEHWPSEPLHCGRCASTYQLLINEVIDLAISAFPSKTLARELSAYDHFKFSEFLEQTLPGYFEVDSIIEHLENSNSSPICYILNRLREERNAYLKRQLEHLRLERKQRIESALSNLAGIVDETSADQFTLALENLFISDRNEVNLYIAEQGGKLNSNIFEQLQTICEPSAPIFKTALRLASETKNWSLIRTLLIILRSDSQSFPDLIAAALECKKRRSVFALINHGAPPPDGPPSPPPEAHLQRLKDHARYNVDLKAFCRELETLDPRYRLWRIAQNERYPLAALPAYFADSEAAMALPEGIQDQLLKRLKRAPKGEWKNLRQQLLQMRAFRT